MSMTIYVHRSPLGDCTLRGISSKADKLSLVNVAGPFEPTEDAPAAMLVSNGKGLVRIVPANRLENGEWAQETRWTMFGGNYAGTSDSRFIDAIQALTGAPWYGAVAIHDRIEP